MHPKYDNNSGDDDIPDDGGDGDDSTDGTAMSREDAIKIQKNKISSLKLDIEENNLNITKLENKVKNKLDDKQAGWNSCIYWR